MSGRTLATTETSFRVIETIRERNGATMEELATELGLAKSTIHGHLFTLIKNHYIVKEDDKYQLGLRFFNLGEYVRTRREVYTRVHNTVVSLSREINEEVDFSVEEYGRTIVLFDTLGHGVKRGFQIGQYFYMNTNAAGKAILSELPNERVEQILGYWGMPAETSKTITDREALYAELKQTRERGYATNDEENFEGIRAISSTIHDPDGSILGALAISGPKYRLPDNEDLIKPLSAAITDLEDDIEGSTAS